MRSVLAVFLLLTISLASGQLCLKSCDSALESVFAAAQAYQCVQMTITSVNHASSAVSYTQGIVYFNRYFNGLVNKDTPSFPVLSNVNVGCANGATQPFNAKSVSTNIGTAPFDVLVTRAGVIRLAVGPQVYINVTLGCGASGLLPATGFDEQGNAYLVQFAVSDLTAGCPANVIGQECTVQGAPAPSNSSTPILCSGNAGCFPPCGDGQSCIVDSGYGRCVGGNAR